MKKSTIIMISGFFLFFIFFLDEPMHADEYSLKGRTITIPDELFSNQAREMENESIVPLTNESLTLEGLTDQVELYYEIPVQEMKKGNQLNLNIQYSSLLLEGSTLTVHIDGQPVYSTKLDVDKQMMDIQVPLTGEALEQGFHTVSVSFYGHLTEEICANEDNPANWMTILPESNVLLTMEEVIERENMLQDYPYPFVQNLQNQPIQSDIVIPDTPSSAILSAALQLANHLNIQAGGEDMVQVVKASELKTISKHLIIVGSNGAWTGWIKDIYDTANVSLSDEQLVISNYYVKAKDTMKQVMLVTAQEDQTIAEKMGVLTESRLHDQFAGDEVSLDQIPTYPDIPIQPKQTFRDLGITNQTLSGQQRMSQNYFYELPSYINLNEPAMLQMKLKVAETLFDMEDISENDRREGAELVILVNGIPHSIAVKDLKKEDDESYYTVQLPVDSSTLKQAAFLTIQFKANGLIQEQFCVPPDDDKWIFIHEDSYLQMGVQNNSGEANFKGWPSPFSSMHGMDGTLMVLPNEDISQQMIDQLLLLSNTIGNQGDLRDLQLVFADNVQADTLKNKHVIVVGNPVHHTYLKEHIDELLITVDESNKLDASGFQFLNKTAESIAWVQPSVWNDNKKLAIFSPMDAKTNAPFMTKHVLEFLETNVQPTNIIVESANGEIFTHEQPSDKENKGHESLEKSTDNKETERWLIIGFIVIVMVGFSLFIYILQKKKKKNNDYN